MLPLRIALKTCLSPLSAVLILLATAILLYRRRRLLRWLAMGALSILFLFSLPAFSDWLIDRLERPYHEHPVSATPPAPAIVVLGGGLLHLPSDQHPAAELSDSTDRLWRAAQLYRAGKAPLLVVSAGGEPKPTEAEFAKRLLVEWGIPETAIVGNCVADHPRERPLHLATARGQAHFQGDPGHVGVSHDAGCTGVPSRPYRSDTGRVQLPGRLEAVPVPVGVLAERRRFGSVEPGCARDSLDAGLPDLRLKVRR